MATSHREAAGDKVEGGETNDEVRRAHKRVDDEDSRVEMSEDETTMATPHAPQSMPLEGEWIEQTSGGTAELTVRKLDHPDENAETRNPTRPPEDPGDAMDDDARHPDEPTEPPDDTESARVRGGEERVEMMVSKAPREDPKGAGDGDEERRPVRPDKPSSNAQVELRDSEDVQVEPGGETKARRSGSVAHENADAAVDEEVGEAR